MTENAKHQLLTSSFFTLNESIAPETSTTLPEIDNSLYINSNMTVENQCIYTSTLPADIANNFPEGTVLQILPDSTILAVPPISSAEVISSSNNLQVTSSYPTELLCSQTQAPISTLLNFANQSESHCPDVPVCTEENITDIDLSFLTEESVNTSKSLSESEVKELQTMIDIVDPNSLGILQNDPSNIMNSLAPTIPELSKKQNGSAEDVVMIDVSKPIQLSQNSLIVVNGQKCILQQDVKTGQVIAYPVQDPTKLHRRRGRPRKTEPVDKNSDQDSASLKEDITEDDKEKGLLEVLNDDGSLVRRSSRKRKTAKTLKDYETGNLKQELGSDVEDSSMLDDIETQNRKKKHKPGSKLKRYNGLQQTFTSFSNSASEKKRARGRPRKQIMAKEPTQAFLVQTADGQTLMLQVPLSNIPSGVSLQEVAECIANKLNIGLNMANNTTLNCDTTQDSSKNLEPGVLLNDDSSRNSTHCIKPLQDHSIGSTTNLQNSNNLINAEHANDSLDNTCGNLYNLEEIIVDTASPADELCETTLKCHKQNNLLPASTLDSNFSDVGEVSLRNTLSTNIPTSNSSLIDSSSLITCVPSNICDNQIVKNNIGNNLSQKGVCDKTQEKDVNSLPQEQFTKDFLIQGEFLRDKVNIDLLLQNVAVSSAEILSGTKIGQCTEVNPSASQNNVTLNTASSLNYSSQIEGDDVIHSVQNVSDFVTSKDLKILNCSERDFRPDLVNSDSILSNHAIINSIKHDHDFLFQEKCPMVVPANETSQSTSELNTISTTGSTTEFQTILPLENISQILKIPGVNDSISTPPAVVIPVSGNQHTSEETLPIVLPSQEKKSKDCKICHKRLNTDDELIQHFKADHPKCICEECNYTAEHAYVLKRHALRHLSGGCICQICGKQYKDLYILKMHIKMVHLPAEVLFTCDKCGKVFTRKAHLKRHLRTHEPDRPYKCSFCNYRGCERSDITKHLLVHETPKHKCHVCEKNFRHLKNLEIHLKRHFKQRDYKCGLCDFYGYTFTDIRKHIERKHAGSKSFNCTECGLLFKNKEALEAHKDSEQCQMSLLEQELVKKEPKDSDENNESIIVENVSFEILDDGQSQTNACALNECDEGKLETESTVLKATEGILTSSENGDLIVDGFETSELLTSGAISLIPGEGDSNRTITLVATNGKQYSLSLKTGDDPLNTVLTTVSTSNESEFYIPEIESEVCK